MGILVNVLRSLRSGRSESIAQEALFEMRRGWEAYRAGHSRDAEKSADVVLASAQGSSELKGDALQLRAFARAANGDFQGALQDFDSALQITPESVDCLLGKGKILHEMNRFEDAFAIAEKIVALDPGNPVAHNNRGLMLREQGRLKNAESDLRCALERDAGFHEARVNLARVLVEMDRLDEADTELATVLCKTPEHAGARWNKAMLNLLCGNFAAGWRDYETRFELPDLFTTRPHKYPRWSGESLREGSLLIYGEQGLGDDILFASCYRDAIARAGRCVIECEPRLENLFSRSFPEAQCIGSKFAQAPDLLGNERIVLAQISAGSLPGIFRNRLEDFPSHRGYLRADPEKVGQWRARLDSLGRGPKIGISWAGGTPRTRRSTRCIPLDFWQPMLKTPDCHFISLQYGDCGAEIADFKARSGAMVHHWPEAIDNYDSTAALVSALDLVISVTTSVVHLAGALGQTVWVLVPANPEWRYLRSGDSMPWYPSARLFRQSEIGDWTRVLSGAGTALRDWLSSNAHPIVRP